MDINGAQFVKILWIGLDLGETVDLKQYDRYRIFTKHDIRYNRNKVISQKYTGD